MKIITNKNLDNMLKKEYNKGISDGENSVNKINFEIGQVYRLGKADGMNSVIYDIQTIFYQSTTEKEFYKRIKETFMKIKLN